VSRDLNILQDRLSQFLPSGGEITGITVLSAGNSNESYHVEGLDLVLRLLPSGEPLIDGHGIVDQFQIQAVIGTLDSAPPVAPVRYLCLDNAVLGEPFFLMQKVEGISFDEYADKSWFTSEADEYRQNVCRQFVESIAGLAKLPILDALGPVRTPAEDCAYWRQYAQQASATKLVDLFDELIARAPMPQGAPSPCHGDAKIANTIWKDGKLAAMLDWEMAYNGDPRMDLGYMNYFFVSADTIQTMYGTASGVWNAEQITAAWEKFTGRRATDIAWFNAVAAAKIAAITLYGGYLFRHNKTSNKKMSAWEGNDFRKSIIGVVEERMKRL
jgi:aminoglycoside phosphotransferase (APT) family kinase protein